MPKSRNRRVPLIVLGLLSLMSVWSHYEASKAGPALLPKLSLFSTDRILHHLNGLGGDIEPVVGLEDGRVRHRVRFRVFPSRGGCDLDLWFDELRALVEVDIGGRIFVEVDQCWRQANVLIRRLRTDYRTRWPDRWDAPATVLTGDRP